MKHDHTFFLRFPDLIDELSVLSDGRHYFHRVEKTGDCSLKVEAFSLFVIYEHKLEDH